MSEVQMFAGRKVEMERESPVGCRASPCLLYNDLFVLILNLIFWVNFALGLICSSV